MNRALWKKAISDAWVQLVASSVLLVAFGWVFVWLMSLLKMPQWLKLLSLLPDFVEPILGIPMAKLATPAGRLSMLYVHVITLLPCIGWAVGRGSDTVSGQISRGTMEFLVTLPARRATLLIAPAVVAAAGSAILALSVWVGVGLGLHTFELDFTVSNTRFLPGVANLFAMTFCLTGLTTLLSAMDRDRWRTIWLAGGLFVLSMIIKLIARFWEAGAWLKYLSFLSAFEPQRLILLDGDGWARYGQLNWPLLAIGCVAYLLAAVVFTWRDIPVPH